MTTNPITSRLFKFLRELETNNNRDWFNANKQRYLDDLRDPLLQFIADVGPPLAKVSRHLIADPRPVGGSLFRIYRDTRFSRDKRPYKTAAAMVFHHTGKGETRGPGYYLHLEPGTSFMGGGIWHPEPPALKSVRDAIVANPKRWRAVRRHLSEPHEGDKLKRPPQGYDPEHEFIEDLKCKSFTTGSQFTETQVCARDFISRFVKSCAKTTPLMEFLAKAVGLSW